MKTWAVAAYWDGAVDIAFVEASDFDGAIRARFKLKSEQEVEQFLLDEESTGLYIHAVEVPSENQNQDKTDEQHEHQQ